ncbi:MAG TPA: glycosyltransferase family 39 protein [Vicinamibacteria bacterium]|nr:glycosyltransferase family 39 protein [Vicinamibacteria bacterium]
MAGRSEFPARALLLLTAAALAARVLLLVLEPSTSPVADERTWANWARTIASPRVAFSPFRTHMIFHPPLYPYFLAVPLALTGSLEAAKWVQATLSVLLVPAVGRVGTWAFGARAGLGAAALAAFYPELVWFAAHFWVENVFLVLLWWGFERLLAADARGRTGPAVAAGVLWGLAVLARETVLYFVPVAALWLVWRRRADGGARRAAALVLSTVLVIVPWTWRNWVEFGAFIPVSTAGGLNLFQGNAPLSRQEVYDEYDAVRGRREQYRHALRRGLESIRDRQPSWLFEKLAEQMPMFWEAESMAAIHIKRGAYGPVPPGRAILFALILLLPYLALLLPFVAGLAGARYGRIQVLLAAFLVHYNLLHVVTHGFNRYRLPVMPVVFLFASWALVAWREGSFPKLSPVRRAVAAALAITLLLSLVPSLRHVRHPAYGFAPAAAETLDEAPRP